MIIIPFSKNAFEDAGKIRSIEAFFVRIYILIYIFPHRNKSY